MKHRLIKQFDNIHKFDVKGSTLVINGRENIEIYKNLIQVGKIPVTNFHLYPDGQIGGKNLILKDKILLTEGGANYEPLYFYSLYGSFYKKMDEKFSTSNGKGFDNHIQIKEFGEDKKYNIILNANTYQVEKKFEGKVSDIYNENYCSGFYGTTFQFFDTKQGKLLWEYDFSKFSYEHSPFINCNFKLGTNYLEPKPILEDNKVLISTKYDRMLAVDIHTGNIVWENLNLFISNHIYYHEGKLYMGENNFLIIDFNTGKTLKHLNLEPLLDGKKSAMSALYAFKYPYAYYPAIASNLMYVNIETMEVGTLNLPPKANRGRIGEIFFVGNKLYIRDFERKSDWCSLYVYEVDMDN